MRHPTHRRHSTARLHAKPGVKTVSLEVNMHRQVLIDALSGTTIFGLGSCNALVHQYLNLSAAVLAPTGCRLLIPTKGGEVGIRHVSQTMAD
jgi:hypothetical protein